MSRLLVSVPFYFGFVYANKKKKKGGSSESSVTSEWKKKKKMKQKQTQTRCWTVHEYQTTMGVFKNLTYYYNLFQSFFSRFHTLKALHTSLNEGDVFM